MVKFDALGELCRGLGEDAAPGGPQFCVWLWTWGHCMEASSQEEELSAEQRLQRAELVSDMTMSDCAYSFISTFRVLVQVPLFWSTLTWNHTEKDPRLRRLCFKYPGSAGAGPRQFTIQWLRIHLPMSGTGV